MLKIENDFSFKWPIHAYALAIEFLFSKLLDLLSGPQNKYSSVNLKTFDSNSVLVFQLFKTCVVK